MFHLLVGAIHEWPLRFINCPIRCSGNKCPDLSLEAFWSVIPSNFSLFFQDLGPAVHIEGANPNDRQYGLCIVLVDFSQPTLAFDKCR